MNNNNNNNNNIEHNNTIDDRSSWSDHDPPRQRVAQQAVRFPPAPFAATASLHPQQFMAGATSVLPSPAIPATAGCETSTAESILRDVYGSPSVTETEAATAASSSRRAPASIDITTNRTSSSCGSGTKDRMDRLRQDFQVALDDIPAHEKAAYMEACQHLPVSWIMTFESCPEWFLRMDDDDDDATAAAREMADTNTNHPSSLIHTATSDHLDTFHHRHPYTVSSCTTERIARNAARRFVSYWEQRKAVFGGGGLAGTSTRSMSQLEQSIGGRVEVPGRAFLPMVQTGTGTLTSSDLELLQSGFAMLLPPDRHGRLVLLHDRARLPTTTSGVLAADPEARLRCLFYLLHVAAATPAGYTSATAAATTHITNKTHTITSNAAFQNNRGLVILSVYTDKTRASSFDAQTLVTPFVSLLAMQAIPIKVKAFHLIMLTNRPVILDRVVPTTLDILQRYWKYLRQRTVVHFKPPNATSQQQIQKILLQELEGKLGFDPEYLPKVPFGGRWTIGSFKRWRDDRLYQEKKWLEKLAAAVLYSSAAVAVSSSSTVSSPLPPSSHHPPSSSSSSAAPSVSKAATKTATKNTTKSNSVPDSSENAPLGVSSAPQPQENQHQREDDEEAERTEMTQRKKRATDAMYARRRRLRHTIELEGMQEQVHRLTRQRLKLQQMERVLTDLLQQAKDIVSRTGNNNNTNNENSNSIMNKNEQEDKRELNLGTNESNNETENENSIIDMKDTTRSCHDSGDGDCENGEGDVVGDNEYHQIEQFTESVDSNERETDNLRDREDAGGAVIGLVGGGSNHDVDDAGKCDDIIDDTDSATASGSIIAIKRVAPFGEGERRQIRGRERGAASSSFSALDVFADVAVATRSPPHLGSDMEQHRSNVEIIPAEAAAGMKSPPPAQGAGTTKLNIMLSEKRQSETQLDQSCSQHNQLERGQTEQQQEVVESLSILPQNAVRGKSQSLEERRQALVQSWHEQYAQYQQQVNLYLRQQQDDKLRLEQEAQTAAMRNAALRLWSSSSGTAASAAELQSLFGAASHRLSQQPPPPAVSHFAAAPTPSSSQVAYNQLMEQRLLDWLQQQQQHQQQELQLLQWHQQQQQLQQHRQQEEQQKQKQELQQQDKRQQQQQHHQDDRK